MSIINRFPLSKLGDVVTNKKVCHSSFQYRIRRTLCFLKHYFGGLEERCHLVPLGKLELVDSLPCDCRRELQLSCVHRDASHGGSLLNVCHPSAHSVSCAYLDCPSVSFDKHGFRRFDECHDGVVLPQP